MRSSAEAGDTIAALRAYELWRLLEDEYDTEPSVPTQQLVADIKLGRVGPLAADPPSSARLAEAPVPVPRLSAAPARIALLVEPFAVNGVAQGQMHLAQGFRHDLIACLVRFREWFVVDGPAMPSAEQTGNRVSGPLPDQRHRLSGRRPDQPRC